VVLKFGDGVVKGGDAAAFGRQTLAANIVIRNQY
jgi:hypothetical protein